ncbi:hypothetical protein [Actinomadura hibisca]|uniref:hypothetical protein n=1 Tax=Actinomadura hibisca TaxID=68565 RepID=UPI00082A4EDA|nr:hypothetical protein [Actinomadura hibisca]
MQIRGRAKQDLGEAIFQALSGRAYSSVEKASTQEAAKAMVDRWGSTKAVAERLGVSVRTVERYVSGAIQNPSKRNRDQFAAAHREAKITPGRKQKAAESGTASGPDRTQTGTGGLAIFGSVRVSEDERDRWITPGSHMTPAEADGIIDAMVQNGPEAAAAALNTVIQRYVPGMHINYIEEIDY